jgi:glyoxylase-like metal-dependent hydrolase (beta-lactamase superfamily II)
MKPSQVVVSGVLFTAIAACSPKIEPLATPGRSSVLITAGSMVYLARTSAGVIAIDLGWSGSEAKFNQGLTQLNARPSDVTMVFLTHSHRDHIAAWPLVSGAQFYLASAEVPLLFGDSTHGGWIPKTADRLDSPHLPKRTEIAVLPFAADTTFTIGADTLRAYLVPGHTAGSAVYLFRGILFLGDAVTHSTLGGFGPAKRGFTADRTTAIESLERLWSRLPEGVQYACTAHADCAPFSEIVTAVRRGATSPPAAR